MSKIITTCSSKGGVGKTSGAISIASILAEHGKKVLLIDVDPQSAATKHLTYEDPDYDWEKTIRQVLLGECNINDVILTPYENFDFIPSQLRLQNIDVELFNSNNPLYRLADVLEDLDKEYDYIIFDTHPDTKLMTRSAMVCSSHIWIFSILESWPLESIQITWEEIENVKKAQKYINHKIKKVMITPTFFEERRELTASFNYALRQGYKSYVSESVIHRSVDIGKTYSSPKGRLKEDMRAYQEYLSAFNELMEDGDE